MNTLSSLPKRPLALVAFVAFAALWWRAAIQEEMGALLLICAASVILLFSVRSRRVYDGLASVTVALTTVNLTGVDASDILVLFLLVTGLAFGHLHLRSLRLPGLLVGFLGAFVAFYIVSIAAGNFDPAFVGHLGSNIGFFCFLKLYVDSEQKMRRLLLSIIGGVLASSLVAVAALVELWAPGDMFFDVVRNFRYMALLGDPNILALLTAFIALWLLDELSKPKLLTVPPWVVGMLLIFAVAQLSLTQSRSGWLNLGVGLLFYVAWDVYRSRIKSAAGIVSAITIVLFFAYGAILLIDAEDILLTRIESFVTRDAEAERFDLVYTRDAIALALDHPWGVGAGLTAERLGYTSLDGLGIGAHNSFVQILSDNGWGTFLAFVAIIMFIGVSLLSRMRKGETRLGVSYQFLVAGLIGLAVNGGFQDLIQWQVAWFLPSLAAIVLWPSGKGHRDDIKRRTSSAHQAS